jgi:hypothetical protein
MGGNACRRPVHRVKAWRAPNEDGEHRPYVVPDVWAADVARYRLGLDGQFIDLAGVYIK